MTDRRMITIVALTIIVPAIVIGLIAKSGLVFLAVIAYGTFRVFS